MEMAARSQVGRSLDLIMIVKVLCLVLITIKLTRLLSRKTNHL